MNKIVFLENLIYIYRKYADLVGISFKNSQSYFGNAKKVVYTGNPCGENALTIKKNI